VIRRRRPSLGKFAPNEAGVSAVEFAFIAPVLILAYFGCAELCGAMLAERKASHTASAIGDLVAQASTVSTSDLTNIFTVGDIIMSPDPTNTLGMRVTSVQADASGATTVGWSQASGTMTALPKNGAITIPSNLIAANQSVIKSEATYVYNVPVAYLLPSAFTYNYTYYLRPRITDPITCTGC